MEAKLGAIVPEGPDREWLRNRLRALLGLEAPPASREENSTAWLRLLEELASAGPAIVVIEDLHWADEALLAFIEYVAGNVAEVPLLVIATARPELFERHPSFAAAIGRVNRIALEPLSAAETERLVAGLLETVRIPGEVRDTVVARSEGNPFYAEESVRLLRDRAVAEASHLLDSVGAERRSREGEAAPVPGSVQAVIAARLDTLPPEHKAVLADAAVIGSVFWGGAVAALGEQGAGRGRRGAARPDRQAAGASRPRVVDGRARASSPSGTLSPATSPTASCRASCVPGSTPPRRRGSRARPASAPRISPRYSRTTTRRRSISPALPAMTSSPTPLVEPAVRLLTLAGDRALAARRRRGRAPLRSRSGAGRRGRPREARPPRAMGEGGHPAWAAHGGCRRPRGGDPRAASCW